MFVSLPRLGKFSVTVSWNNFLPPVGDRYLQCRPEVAHIGVQNGPPQNVTLLHEDYFELKAIVILQDQVKLLLFA